LPCLPTDWNFDHYGVVASLVVAAFHGLAKEEQESAEVQSRLTEALLGGREDLLTFDFVFTDRKEGSKADAEEDKLLYNIDNGKWKGPFEEFDEIPEEWNEGDGTILMKIAWELWESSTRARNYSI
jgi:hypothetical protein